MALCPRYRWVPFTILAVQAHSFQPNYRRCYGAGWNASTVDGLNTNVLKHHDPVSGTLKVTKSGIQINTISRPGAAVGEISLLLDAPYSATVVASEPCVLRHAADGRTFLASNPQITHLIAAGLAERLHYVTSYLADLKNQYGDSPGLAMVGEVLHQLAHHQRPPARPGSAREPNPDY